MKEEVDKKSFANWFEENLKQYKETQTYLVLNKTEELNNLFQEVQKDTEKEKLEYLKKRLEFYLSLNSDDLTISPSGTETATTSPSGTETATTKQEEKPLLSMLVAMHNIVANKDIERLAAAVKNNVEDGAKGKTYEIPLLQQGKITIINKETGDLYVADFAEQEKLEGLNCHCYKLDIFGKKIEAGQSELFKEMKVLVNREGHIVNFAKGYKQYSNVFGDGLNITFPSSVLQPTVEEATAAQAAPPAEPIAGAKAEAPAVPSKGEITTIAYEDMDSVSVSEDGDGLPVSQQLSQGSENLSIPILGMPLSETASLVSKISVASSYKDPAQLLFAIDRSSDKGDFGAETVETIDEEKLSKVSVGLLQDIVPPLFQRDLDSSEASYISSSSVAQSPRSGATLEPQKTAEYKEGSIATSVALSMIVIKYTVKKQLGSFAERVAYPMPSLGMTQTPSEVFSTSEARVEAPEEFGALAAVGTPAPSRALVEGASSTAGSASVAPTEASPLSIEFELATARSEPSSAELLEAPLILPPEVASSILGEEILFKRLSLGGVPSLPLSRAPSLAEVEEVLAEQAPSVVGDTSKLTSLLAVKTPALSPLAFVEPSVVGAESVVAPNPTPEPAPELEPAPMAPAEAPDATPAQTRDPSLVGVVALDEDQSSVPAPEDKAPIIAIYPDLSKKIKQLLTDINRKKVALALRPQLSQDKLDSEEQMKQNLEKKKDIEEQIKKEIREMKDHCVMLCEIFTKQNETLKPMIEDMKGENGLLSLLFEILTEQNEQIEIKNKALLLQQEKLYQEIVLKTEEPNDQYLEKIQIAFKSLGIREQEVSLDDQKEAAVALYEAEYLFEKAKKESKDKVREANESIVKAALAEVKARSEDTSEAKTEAEEALATALKKVEQSITAEIEARESALSASPELQAFKKVKNNAISKEQLDKVKAIEGKVKAIEQNITTSYTYDVEYFKNQVVAFQKTLGYTIEKQDTCDALREVVKQALNLKSQHIDGHQYVGKQLITDRQIRDLQLTPLTEVSYLEVEAKYRALVEVLAESQAKVIEKASGEIKNCLLIQQGQQLSLVDDYKKVAFDLVKASYVDDEVRIKVKSGEKAMDAAKAIASVVLGKLDLDEALKKVREAMDAEATARESALSASPELQAFHTELQLALEKSRHLIVEKERAVKNSINKIVLDRTHTRSSMIQEAVKELLTSSMIEEAVKELLKTISGNTEQEKKCFCRDVSNLENKSIGNLTIKTIQKRPAEPDSPELSKTVKRLVREGKICIPDQLSKGELQEPDPFEEKIKELVALLKAKTLKTEKLPNSSVSPQASKLLHKTNDTKYQ